MLGVFLDDDASGFISLREIDPDSADLLTDFKCWVDDQFGGVRYAFGAWDIDKSASVSLNEFRKAFARYGYQGDCNSLFGVFDVDSQGTLSVQEVSFLDEWERQNEFLDRLGALTTSSSGALRVTSTNSGFSGTPRLQELARPKSKGVSPMSARTTICTFGDEPTRCPRPQSHRYRSPYYARYPKSEGDGNKQRCKATSLEDPVKGWTTSQRIEARNLILQMPIAVPPIGTRCNPL